MILDRIISAIVGLVSGVLGLFPSWSFGLDLESTGSTLGQALGVADNYFPVGIVLTCLGVVLGLKVALLVFNAVVFVYRLIPGKFT